MVPSSKAKMAGTPRSPRTPKSFQGFNGVYAPGGNYEDEMMAREREPSWMSSLLGSSSSESNGRFGAGGAMTKDSRSNSVATAVPANFHRRTESYESNGPNQPWTPGHYKTASTSSSSSSSHHSHSTASSANGSPARLPIGLMGMGSGQGTMRPSPVSRPNGLYGELSLNLSQLSLSSSSSAGAPPSLVSGSSVASTPSSASSGAYLPPHQQQQQYYGAQQQQQAKYRSNSPSGGPMFNPAYSLRRPAAQPQVQTPQDDNEAHLVDGLYYHFDELDMPSPNPSSYAFASAPSSAASGASSVGYPGVSPTSSASSYSSSSSSSSKPASTNGAAPKAVIAHEARKTVTEYECGKVGVLGGAVMLGVAPRAQHQPQQQAPKGTGARW